MKQLSSADFRKSYASETEPVEVTSYGKAIGTWFPAGVAIPEPAGSNPPVAVADPEPAPTRMTIRPAQVNPRGPLTGTTQRILDPVQRAQRERELWSQLQAKMNTSSRRTR